MKITITDTNNFHTFDVDPDEEVENVKALIEVQMSIPIHRQQLLFQGRILKDKEKLNQAGIQENQLLYMVLAPTQQPQQNPPPKQPAQGVSIADMIKNFDKQKKDGNIGFPEKKVQDFMAEAQRTYDQLKDDHYRLSQLSGSQPQLINFILNKDIQGIAGFLKNHHDQKVKKMQEEEKKFRELQKDPMNPEYQKMLEERIQQENINKNLQYAHQYVPEVFGHITMLYINASINKVPIKAFVDSGAQSTIMSQSLANRCGLMRLVDKRHAGMAMGVGSCKILGKIHAAELQIEGKLITCSFTVIENNSTQFLLGLDMLKRFSCNIDLKNNQLVFQDGLIVTKFLSDGEVKKFKSSPSEEELNEKLKKLAEMGFGKEEALSALKSCNYNEQVASNILSQKRFGK